MKILIIVIVLGLAWFGYKATSSPKEEEIVSEKYYENHLKEAILKMQECKKIRDVTKEKDLHQSFLTNCENARLACFGHCYHSDGTPLEKIMDGRVTSTKD